MVYVFIFLDVFIVYIFMFTLSDYYILSNIIESCTHGIYTYKVSSLFIFYKVKVSSVFSFSIYQT